MVMCRVLAHKTFDPRFGWEAWVCIPLGALREALALVLTVAGDGVR